jgi:hypothetical protein
MIDGISNDVIIRCQKILFVSISFLDVGFQFLGAVERSNHALCI